MVAINNGINAHGGLKTFGSTFLSFSDYCKGAIRLAAISQIPTINIFTHDTITVGEDGPTHQPIEQIWSLRLIPNHHVFRPFNDVECVQSLALALSQPTAPSTIICSRGTFINQQTNLDDAKNGAYVVYENEQANLTIIATGSEVAIALELVEILKQEAINIRVVSAPCLSIFEQQAQAYKDKVLGTLPKISIEFGVTAP
jgi:transketolase